MPNNIFPQSNQLLSTTTKATMSRSQKSYTNISSHTPEGDRNSAFPPMITYFNRTVDRRRTTQTFAPLYSNPTVGSSGLTASCSTSNIPTPRRLSIPRPKRVNASLLPLPASWPPVSRGSVHSFSSRLPTPVVTTTTRSTASTPTVSNNEVSGPDNSQNSMSLHS